MKNIKKILLAVVAVLAVVTLTACSTTGASNSKKSTWTKIQAEKNKTVTIGFDDTFVPMGFKAKDGSYKGFDVDLANALFKKYDIKVKWQPINWSMKESELKSGQIDLIWNGYDITPARKKLVLFSNPYMVNKQVLVTRKADGITSDAQMKGKTVGLQTGSSEADAFDAQPDVLKNIVAGNKATLYSTFDLAFIDLKAGKIQGLLVDECYAQYYLQQAGVLSDYNIVDTKYPNEDFAVGARKGDTQLVGKINSALKAMHKDGSFQKISQKWFGRDVYPGA